MGRRLSCLGATVALLTLAGCGGKSSPVGSARTTTSAPQAAPAPPSGTATTPPAGTTTTPPAPSTGTAPPSTVPPSTVPPSTAPAAPTPFLPPGVPDHASGQDADPGDLAVVKRWLAALQRGRIQAAADVFADGAVVINATPPLRLRTREERIAFNRTFPCGAEVVRASTVKGYLLVTYRLTDRTGSACDGPGGQAFGAVKVTRGRITEWYRLPDPAQAPAPGAGPVV